MTDPDCTCTHTKRQHRHVLMDDRHPAIPIGQSYIFTSAGSCSVPGCECDQYAGLIDMANWFEQGPGRTS